MRHHISNSKLYYRNSKDPRIRSSGQCSQTCIRLPLNSQSYTTLFNCSFAQLLLRGRSQWPTLTGTTQRAKLLILLLNKTNGLPSLQINRKGGRVDDHAIFDLFFRKCPFKGEFCVFAGLDEILPMLQSFRFTASDVDYLRTLLTHAEDAFFDWLLCLGALRTWMLLRMRDDCYSQIAPVRRSTQLTTARWSSRRSRCFVSKARWQLANFSRLYF